MSSSGGGGGNGGCFVKCYCCFAVYAQSKLTEIRIYVDDALEQSFDGCYCPVCRWCPLREKCKNKECGFIHSDSENTMRPPGLTAASLCAKINGSCSGSNVNCNHKYATYRAECPDGALAAYRALCQPNCDACRQSGSRCILCNRNTYCQHKTYTDSNLTNHQIQRTCTTCFYSGVL